MDTKDHGNTARQPPQCVRGIRDDQAAVVSLPCAAMAHQKGKLQLKELLEDEEAAEEVGAALSQRRHTRQAKGHEAKRDISHRPPLPAADGPAALSVGSISRHRGDERQLEACRQLLEKLPKNSAYAKSRRAMLEKAIQLLQLEK